MNFKIAKVTNSRLMGSLGLIIKWEKEEDKFFQYFLLDAEGLGVSDYVSLTNLTEKDDYIEEERLMGGLGSDRIDLTKDEALLLLKSFVDKNLKYDKELPKNSDEFLSLLNDFNTNISYESIFNKILKNIDNEVEFINYMVMRFIARDRECLYYFSKNKDLSNMHITSINGTLLKNTVTKKSNNKFISEAIYEDNDGYYTCKIAMSIEKYKNSFELNSIIVGERESIFDFEVFDEISKEEFICIYNIKNKEEFLEKFYIENPFLQKSEIDDNSFFTLFKFNNNHIKDNIYVINNDIKSLFYQVNDEFFVSTYSEEDRKNINKILVNNYDEFLTEKEQLYFEENVLYDFIESGSDDFDDFLDI